MIEQDGRFSRARRGADKRAGFSATSSSSATQREDRRGAALCESAVRKEVLQHARRIGNRHQSDSSKYANSCIITLTRRMERIRTLRRSRSYRRSFKRR